MTGKGKAVSNSASCLCGTVTSCFVKGKVPNPSLLLNEASTLRKLMSSKRFPFCGCDQFSFCFHTKPRRLCKWRILVLFWTKRPKLIDRTNLINLLQLLMFHFQFHSCYVSHKFLSAKKRFGWHRSVKYRGNAKRAGENCFNLPALCLFFNQAFNPWCLPVLSINNIHFLQFAVCQSQQASPWNVKKEASLVFWVRIARQH